MTTLLSYSVLGLEDNNIVYKRALSKKGTHCSYKGAKSFDSNSLISNNNNKKKNKKNEGIL